MKELLIYSTIFSFIAEEFVKEVESNKAFDLIVRINSAGGNVFDGWGMIGKLSEHEADGKKVKIKIDGNSSSMATIFAAMFKDVEALDVTHLMIHKATMFTETQAEIDLLANVNKDLQAALEKKIDDEKLLALKGVTIADIFAPDFERVDIWLTAEEAKEVGLISEVTSLVEKEFEAINKKIVAYNKKFIPLSPEKKPKGEKPKENKSVKSKQMTVEEFKAKHPEAYAAAVKEGVTAEKQRVEAWLVFAEVDAKSVKEGIENGDNLTPKATAEFAKKEFSLQALKNNDDDNADDSDTDDVNDDDKPVDSFEKELRAKRKKVIA